MKKILILCLISTISILPSCSNDDDCADKKKEIYDQYDDIIKKYQGDNARIELVIQDRERALQKACN